MSPSSAGEPGQPPDQSKSLTAYCQPWSVRAGETVTLHASSLKPDYAALSLVRLSCGDRSSTGPGFAEEQIETKLPGTVQLERQPITPGSFAEVAAIDLVAAEKLRLTFSALLTRVSEPQTLATVIGSAPSGPVQLTVLLGDDGLLRATVGSAELVLRSRPLADRRWYDIEIDLALDAGRITGTVTTEPSASPGRDLMEPNEGSVGVDVELPTVTIESLFLASDGTRANLDGRIARPRLELDDIAMAWDLGQDMGGRAMIDASSYHRHGEFHQLPTRAVTGPTWDGSHQRWADDPSQWAAVHFHKDDLYDAGWAPTTSLTIPEDLPSGIYAFKLWSDAEEDRVPFFVRPAQSKQTNRTALLMSTATYMAYANHRMLFDGADFIQRRRNLRPEHAYVRDHPEVGRSMYEKHPDGSGVMFSSRLRPVLNLRPGADGWNFTPDTDINAFLEHLEIGHDIVTDEDLHHEGLAALESYDVLVTCSHPEYWSTAMLDALASWQRAGGRMLYLGGNGFYWRVAFSDAWPGAMELRRAEDGVRNWQTGDGENYHAFGGEYGGMWRRLGRPPNEIAGIGFAAQGFEKASFYEVNDDCYQSRASWILDGVVTEDGRIGTSGLGGGAAGQELDRYDPRLGSPSHAVVVASATTFAPDMVRTKEEFEGSVVTANPDPYVRADIVFYETPNGGAVFSVGSISWFGALARNGYDNDIAQMTTNVVRRFLDPTPFEPPV